MVVFSYKILHECNVYLSNTYTYLLLPIVFSVLFQPLELIALNAYLSMAQIHPVKTHFTTTTHPTSWRGPAWGAAKVETDFFQPQLVLKYLEPMVSSINRHMPTYAILPIFNLQYVQCLYILRIDVYCSL